MKNLCTYVKKLGVKNLCTFFGYFDKWLFSGSMFLFQQTVLLGTNSLLWTNY